MRINQLAERSSHPGSTPGCKHEKVTCLTEDLFSYNFLLLLLHDIACTLQLNHKNNLHNFYKSKLLHHNNRQFTCDPVTQFLNDTS